METASHPANIFSLPPEILVLVLRCLVASNNQPLGRRYGDLIRLTLSTSYIRQVALTAPSLWTHIEITDEPASFELAKACLDRSGSHKLDIAIRVARRVGTKLPGVIALLNYVASRIRELRLAMGLTREVHWEQLHNVLDTFELPALECLEIDLWDAVDLGSQARSIPLPTSARGLQSVVLVKLRPILPAPPVRHLKNLSLSSVSLERWPLGNLWDLLAQSDCLETLELKGEGTTDFVRMMPLSMDRDQRTVTAPKLRRLALSRFDSNLLAYLLLGIEAPELKVVTLVILGFKDTWSVRYPWIDTTVIRPFPSVSTLDVSFLAHISPVVTAPLPKFIHDVFPNIQHLLLSRYTAGVLLPFWTDIYAGANSPTQASCWPFLRRLTLVGSDQSSEWIEKLKLCRLFLAERARKSLPALEAVSLNLSSDAKKNPQIESWMRDIRRLLDY
ncbi:hypothetical protein FRC04_008431 [Tulasnella sp. 424]|nr:hypothetical protein FRC04_008431 [Tulasnella sp. 424]KAG8976801.1 hypothetical protein FRC05_003151 [Tulasnella sp. 425]